VKPPSSVDPARAAAEAEPRGGVIDLTRHYQGIDTRLTHRGELLVPVTLTAGLDYENMSERRKGYENFVMVNGAPQYGEQGALRVTNAT
jgi:iron complex outermembrane receptor protein